MPGIQGSLKERFWSKVYLHGPLIIETPCWEWTSSKNRQGYGVIGAGGSEGKQLLAHRVSWNFAYGTIPNNLCVLHRCDNPSCVNPTHLWLGSRTDNVKDMDKKERRASLRKLTKEQIITIFHDTRTLTLISKDYKIHKSLVWQIKKGKTHSKITEQRL